MYRLVEVDLTKVAMENIHIAVSDRFTDLTTWQQSLDDFRSRCCKLQSLFSGEEMKARDTRRATSTPQTNPVVSDANPATGRRRQIGTARKLERAAAQSYHDALTRASSCDPLCVDYEPRQKQLEFCAEALLTAREMLQRALAGVVELENVD